MIDTKLEIKYNSFRYIAGLIVLFCLGSVLFAIPANIPIQNHLSDIGFVGEEERNTEIYFHNNSVNHLWYGTDRWAVKFDIGNYAVIADSFTIRSLKIYFPHELSENSYSLSLFTDKMQPLDSLFVEKNQLTFTVGWNELNLSDSEIITGNNFWVVIDYETDVTTRFMAASALGGSNSYFWIPPEGEESGYFANMGEYNIESELLVSIGGILHFNGYDLELSMFSFQPEANIRPGGSIHPQFTIKNNSNTDVFSTVGVNVQLTNAAGELDLNMTVPIDLNLAAGNETTITANEPFHTYRLLGYPSQYRLRAELVDENDLFTLNNVISFSLDTFRTPYNRTLIETFVRSEGESSENILTNVNELAADSVDVINMFFSQQDGEYYSDASRTRKDFYRLGGYPFTIVNGKNIISGYTDTYQDSLNNFMTSNRKTFITKGDQSTFSKTIDSNDLQILLEFQLKNSESYIFNSYLRNLKLFAAFVEINEESLFTNNLIELRYYPVNLDSLAFGGRQQLSITANLAALETAHNEEITLDNLADYKLIYWIQNIDNKKMYFSDSLFLSEFELGEVTSVDNKTAVPKLSVSAYPNPFHLSSPVNIKLNSPYRNNHTEIGIYNIKGQLLKKIELGAGNSNFVWDGSYENGQQVPAGVYLIKAETGNLNKYIKIMLIK